MKYERVPMGFTKKSQAIECCKDLNKTAKKYVYTYRKQRTKGWGLRYQIYKRHK